MPRLTGIWLACVLLGGCFGSDPTGIARSHRAATTVKVDLFHRPLPDLPLPNDLATRYDPSSATGRRINVSMNAATRLEKHFRQQINQLDGWGIFQTISIPFTGPLDLTSIIEAHADHHDQSDDVVLLIDIDPHSPEFGKLYHLDLGNGNFPVIAETLDAYGKNDPRGWTLSLLFEEEDEDENNNGKLDPGEDTDTDGVLDRPNYLPGRHPERDDLAGRADALMTFYERETHTLLVRPMLPLNERTTYAVVVTRRLKDESGRPVGSPYPSIHHTSQTKDLRLLSHVLPRGTGIDDVAFAFTFTTQTIQSQMQALRDGLYGHGVQAHLGQSFPAELASLEQLRDAKYFPKMKNAFILPPEHFLDIFPIVAKMALTKTFGNTTDSTLAQVREDQQFVDYHVIGSFESPQLFRRTDARGDPLELSYRTWPEDLDRSPADPTGETVYFWLTVPRKEVSLRGQGKPAPVVVQSHGYNSTRAEGVIYGAFLARYGIANISIDCPSHGLAIGPVEAKAARVIAEERGILPLLEAVLKDRAVDQNNDGIKDSGADFLSAYTFHTRDMMRQTVLDYMQLIRIVRTFDGKRRWAFDVSGDGKPELAGDFDGDGKVDLDGSKIIGMIGTSLGGITSLLIGSLEPSFSSVVSIAGAGGLGDVALRSHQGGVPEAAMLRLMGPLYVGTLDQASGRMELETVVPDTIEQRTLHFATVQGVKAGDTMVVENLRSGERGCGQVSPDGRVHAALASDQGDRLKITFFAGPAVAGKDCELRNGVRPHTEVARFQVPVKYQGHRYEVDEPLVAVTEGLGRRRASPGLRRLMGLTQLMVDPGDPVSYVRHLQRKPLRYPGTKETTGASLLITAGVGDMSVNVGASVTAARAAGIVDFLRADPRYDKPINQVLIDTHTVEGVHNVRRFTSPAGTGIHMDVDNFSGGMDMWGDDVPRLDPPLRVGSQQRDRWGGFSTILFPYSDPEGIHVFALPGMMTDQARARCKEECTKTTGGGGDPCGCKTLETFDIGLYMMNALSRYVTSRGKVLRLEPCNGSDTCPDKVASPGFRDPDGLY